MDSHNTGPEDRLWNGLQLSMATDNKHPSWVWGWGRKIHPKDHRLAWLGLPSDEKRCSRGLNFFYPICTRIMDFFSCTPLNTLTWERLPENPGYAAMRRDIHMTWWRHFNITMAPRIDVRPACSRHAAVRFFYLSQGFVRVREIDCFRMGGTQQKTRSGVQE